MKKAYLFVASLSALSLALWFGLGREKKGPQKILVPQVLAEASREAAAAEISIQNLGVAKKVSLEGTATADAVKQSLPYPNRLVLIEVSGAALKAALHGGVDRASLGERFAGAMPVAAGLQFQVDLQHPAGRRVSAIRIWNELEKSWQDLDEKRLYQLATTDFLASGRDGFQAFKGAKVLKLIEKSPAQLVWDYLQKQ